MIPELGQFALVLSGVLALTATVCGFAGAARHNPTWTAITVSASVGQFVFILVAFAALAWSFYVDDFSVAYVANHSNSLLPWYYKVSAVWGGHEGSFLLWIVFMTGWMLMVVSLKAPTDLGM